MTYDYKLSEDEMKTIAREINKKLSEQIISSAVFKELSEKTQAQAKAFADILMGKNAFEADVRELIKPIVLKQLKDEFSYNDTVALAIREYFKTDEFKKKQLQELERRVEELKEELGIND